MAKRQPEKSFSELMWDAKTFSKLVAFLTEKYRRQVEGRQSRLSQLKPASTNERKIAEHRLKQSQANLKAVEVQWTRFEAIRGNRRIPAALRKEIEEAELQLLRAVSSVESSERGSIRELRDEIATLYTTADRHLNPPRPFSSTNATFEVGETYPRQSITRAYDGHVWEVLKGQFDRAPKSKGQRAQVLIIAALPEKDEYLQLKATQYSFTVESLVERAYGIVGDLQSEMEKAYDNTLEGMKESEVGTAREDAASRLEDISDNPPLTPESLSAIRIVHFPSTKQSSRRVRAREAAAELRTVLTAVENHLATGIKLKKTEAKSIAVFRQHIKHHASELEEIHFPGMFG